MVALGLFGIAIIFLFQDITVSNEDDYYLLKEITEAAMVDSIDLVFYRESGEVKIIQEKFVEVFIRRFSETVSLGKAYKIDFYDIIEYPPKASVRIRTDSSYFASSDSQGNGQLDEYSPKIDTLLSGVLETVVDTTVSRNASAGYYDLNDLYERSDFD